MTVKVIVFFHVCVCLYGRALAKIPKKMIHLVQQKKKRV